MCMGRISPPSNILVNFRSFRKYRNTGVVVETDPIKNNSFDGETGDTYLTRERSIFRTEARLHYIINQEKLIFPRFLSEKLFIVLWILALLLTTLGSAVVFWPLIERLRWG